MARRLNVFVEKVKWVGLVGGKKEGGGQLTAFVEKVK